jgi:pimeloyl-ACP methyl ester carboxylesterase
MELRSVRTTVLDIAYLESGPGDGPVVVLMHGFPYDAHAFTEVVPILNAAGCRTIVPYLRGYGPTRFLSAATQRSGEQAAVGGDLLALLDALAIESGVLAGFDWGGRAACVVAALWPERVGGLVSCAGYQIIDIANAAKPASPEQELRFWYQYYLHTERGIRGLTENRAAIARLLWELWSPNWAFDDATFARTAQAFDNPDFVDVAVHFYRHRHGNAAGDPRYAEIEAKLARQPRIEVPTIVIHGENDGVVPVDISANHDRHFAGPYERRVFPDVGHNPPQEAPQAFAEAVLPLCRRRP